MSKLKEKIKKMKCMEGIVLQRRLRNDKNLKSLINAYDNGNVILYENKGENLLDKKEVYHIKIDDPNGGFFACWWWTLHELYFCEKYNLYPIVDWTANNAYYEPNGVEGKTNPFEYYFKQVSEFNIDDLNDKYEQCNIINVRTKKRNTYLFGNDFTDLVKINKKYLKLNDKIETQIMDDINKLLNNKKTLAVHVRGVEWGNVKGHPVPLSLDKYIEKIDEAFNKYDFEQIFLATDSEDTIDYLSNKYSGKIVFYNDVARASKGSKTLALFDNTIQRENNHYLLGLEVLRDMLTLAYCDGLIAGLSNISVAAQITKISNEGKYDFLNIFEQKINQNGISSGEAVAKMKNKN